MHRRTVGPSLSECSSGSDAVVAKRIDFQTEPARYRHWKLKFDGELAELLMDVDENAGLFEGYQLKLNSYDLGVDIELADAVQRLRFEHPEVKVVVLKSGKDRVFCAGANIRMLAGSTHAPQGELLQVHQRDAQRHGGRERRVRPEVHVRHSRHGCGRRLRAGTRDRLHPAGRRRQFLRGAARAAAARRAAGHGRPHARDRQAQGAPRSRRCLLHGRGGRARDPRGEVAARRPDGAQLEVRRRREGGGQEARSAIGPSGRCQRHRADADRAQDRRRCRHLFQREGGDRPRNAARHHHHPGAHDPAARLRRGHARRRAPNSGRCGSRASSTMPSCTCASTRARSAC